jgi:ketosteroid isomerase-like protein
MLGHSVTGTEQEALPRMALRGKRRRPLEDRFALRFPMLATQVNAWLTRVSLRVPRHWRLRQRLIEWATWRAFNALSRGDVGVVRTITHAEAVWDLSRWDWPEESTYHGRDGAVRFNEHWLNQFSELNFDVFSTEEVEPGVIFIHVQLRGIGSASGAEVGRDVFELVRMRDGLVWRGTMFDSRAEAMAAVRAPDSRAEPSPV